MEKSNLNFHDKTVILVEFFIKKESLKAWTSKEWSRERFAAKKLFTRYPDFSFFYSLQELYGKFNSLLGLLNNKYSNIQDKYDVFILEKQRNKEYHLGEPVVKIEEIKVKAKNLMEFLDN